MKKIRNHILFVFITLVIANSYAQKETNIWYFGDYAGLDFNTGSPVALIDSQLETDEGCATMSDEEGSLMFYTDGSTVWNKNHQIMLDGTDLNGHYSSTNSAIIIPKPEDSNIYYIFTVAPEGWPNGLQYSELDMTLDSGLGGITTNKNILLHTPTTEQVTAVKSSVSNSYWVISHKLNENEFIAYEVTNSGVNTLPVISALGPAISDYRGAMKISPNGKKLASANKSNGYLGLCDFDAATGIVSNLMNLGINAYGVEFSPNNKLLYSSNLYENELSQFNIESNIEADIVNSKIELTNGVENRPLGALQLAPDGKIYIAREYQRDLDVINNPNTIGLGCNYEYEAIHLEGKISRLGLPPFISTFFYIEGIDFENTCFEDLTKFTLKKTVDSVVWDFGDPVSGINNTSTDFEPTHIFSNLGDYVVSVTVIFGLESSTETILVTIYDVPVAYQIDDIVFCEDEIDTGLSSFFDTSQVEIEALSGQTGMFVSYFDENGNELPSPLPNPMTNSIANNEIITVRVSNENNPSCYAETTFELIAQPIPEIFIIDDIFECENTSDGFGEFDLSNIESIVLGGQTGMSVEYFDGNGNQLPNPLPNPYLNSIPNQETITVRVINDATDCYNETTFNLNVNENPIANPIDTIIGCDDNVDGISEYFDTTIVENIVLGSQTGMEVSYFDALGNILPNPLPNPFTNTEPNSQNITIRVTNSQTSCYSETILTLETATQPNINQPDSLYACNEGDGFAHFDTSAIEGLLIGSQTGLEIVYFDDSGNIIPSPLPNSYLNTTPFSQTINVRVENTLNPLCYSETSFNLIVNELPAINLEDDYLICNLDPSLALSVSADYYSYTWYYGTELISETHEVIIIEEGNYRLIVTELSNGIQCENTFDFTLSRSVLPEIVEVEYDEFGSNFIRIIVSGDGDFEYSIDGINFQDSNYFNNISGGIYTAYVRDKYGCGEDSQELTLIDYPKFFTPNNDGYKDTWQVYGIRSFGLAKIYIYDRYGKLLKQLSPNGIGWDGTFNGELLGSNDFWFTVDLNNGKTFKGHFALKR